VVNPFASLFAGTFQPLGFAALMILFVMAATSHDFWLANLGAATWKRIHMLVYLAYALVVLHVALGALQSERNPLLVVLVAAGVTWILGLHLGAALLERRRERVTVCRAGDIPENGARIVTTGGKRIAVFRHDGRLSALSNVCAHQGGPLGEGRIIDGCVTCPWHGYQYLPDTGEAPPPFTERVATYNVRVVDGNVEVEP
jgi:nitrite reductase/ring-hydroxylating ferredoxin subunit